MIKILITDAFELVIRAMDNQNEQLASELLKIIGKQISKDDKTAFSSYIEVKSKNETRVIRQSVERYGKGITIEESAKISS